MVAGLPIVGAQVVLLGASVFNRDAAMAAAQLHRINIASERLAHQSKFSIAGFTGLNSAIEKTVVSQKAAARSSRELERAESVLATQRAQTVAAQAAILTAQHRVTNAEIQAAAARRQLGESIRANTSAYARRTLATNAVTLAQTRLNAAIQAGNAPAHTLARLQYAIETAQARLVIATNNASNSSSRLTRQRALVVKSAGDLTRAETLLAGSHDRASGAAARQSAALVGVRASTIAAYDATQALNAAQTEQAAKQAIANTVALAANTAKLGAVITGVGVAAAAFSGTYEKQLNITAALGEATVQQTREIDKEIKEISKTSNIGIRDLAKGSQELIKAGVSIGQVTHDALKGVNDLAVASAGELGLANAATLVAVGLNAFSESGATVIDIADTATAAVQRSAISFTGFDQAMKQGAGTAARYGLTIQEFGAVVGQIGKTIRSGTEVGTGLQQMFLKLQDPSKANIALMHEYKIGLYDAAGNARPFRDVLIDLEKTFGDAAVAAGELTEKQRDEALASLFGSRAVKTINALLREGVAGYDAMLEATNRLKASDLAGKMLDPLNEKFKILINNIDRVFTEFGALFIPVVKGATEALIAFFQAIDVSDLKHFVDGIQFVGIVMQNLEQKTNIGKAALLGFAAAVTIAKVPVIKGFTLMAAAAIRSAVASTIAWIAATGPIAIGLIALGAVVAVIAKAIFDNWDKLGKGLLDVGNFIADVWTAVANAGIEFGNTIIKIFTGTWQGSADVTQEGAQGVVDITEQGMVGVEGQIAQTGNAIQSAWARAWSGMTNIVARALNWMGTQISNWIAGHIAGGGPFADFLKTFGMGWSAGTTAFASDFSSAIRTVGGVASALGTEVNKVTVGIGKEIETTVGSIKDAISQIEAIFQVPKFNDELRDWQSFLQDQGGLGLDEEPSTVGVPTEPGGNGAGGGGGGGDGADKAKGALGDARELEEDISSSIDNIVRWIEQKFGEIAAKLAQGLAQVRAESKAEEEALLRDTTARIAEEEERLVTSRQLRARREGLAKLLEEEAKARNERDEITEIANDRSLEDQEIFHEHELENAEIAHQEQLDEDEDFRNKQQDIALKAFQSILDEENRLRGIQLENADLAYKQRQEIEENALKRQLDLQAQIRDYHRQDAEALREIEEEKTKTIEEANKERESNIERAAEARRMAIQRSIDSDNLTPERQSNIDIIFARSAARANKQFNEAQTEAEATAAAALKEYQEESVRTRRLAEEDRIFREQQDAQLRELRLKHDAQDRERRRAQEIADREFSEEQEVKLGEFREKQRAKELEARRAIEEKELERRRRLEEEELKRQRKLEDEAREREKRLEESLAKFEARQEARRREQEDELENEALSLTVKNLEAERDERVQTIRQALAEKETLLREQAAREYGDTVKDMDEQLTVIRTRLLDKLPEILEKAGESIRPEINRISDAMISRMDEVATTATSMGSAIAEALAQFKAFDEARTAIESLDIPGFAKGGVVPGPVGKAQLAVVHGGEKFAGVHGEQNRLLRTPASVRAAESKASVYNYGGETHNHYEYKVDANYSNSQSPDNIRLDLEAIVALSRR